MNFEKFTELLENDFDLPEDEQRFNLILDFDTAVYYDTKLDKYWYYSEDDEECVEVELVAQLTYKAGFPDYLAPGIDEDDIGWELDHLIPNYFCGEELDGFDWLWFDVVDKKNKTTAFKRIPSFQKVF